MKADYTHFPLATFPKYKITQNVILFSDSPCISWEVLFLAQQAYIKDKVCYTYLQQALVAHSVPLGTHQLKCSCLDPVAEVLAVTFKNTNTKLKVDMPIWTCIFFTFNWLTLTPEMHFVKFRPEVASCLLSRGKRKYAPLGMRLLWKYIRNYFLVYQLISHFLLYLQNYKEFEAEILDLQSEKYGLSFDIKKYTTSGWALGDENVIGIRAFNLNFSINFCVI